MRSSADGMHLVAMVNPPTSQYSDNWRHPLSRRDWLSAEFYLDLGRTLERGCFDMLFLPDALAVPEDNTGDFATTLVTGGKGAIYLDPMVTLSLVAGATRHLGLAATISTTFTPAYTIARKLLSLDHLSGGRVAWNIVTSTTDAEAANFSLPSIPPKSERYDRADDVVQTVVDLWDTWQPGALTLDGPRRRFADPEQVQRIPERPLLAGGRPLSRGPITLPRSPQGKPVLMQAGSSPRGMEFAARWAEVVFIVADTPDAMRAVRTELRCRAVAAGRNPDHLAVLPAVQPITGSTRDAAFATVRDLEAALDEQDVLTKLGRLLHASREELEPDGSAEQLLLAHRGATGSEGFEQMLLAAARRQSMTVRDLANAQAMNQLHPQPVGDPADIADYLCELYDSEAADGFVIMSALYPSSLEDFVNGVVPELQSRGRFRTSYSGRTLREHLGAPA
ncbi:NtaA/DmoA family FMN-dependent monooxygenase [Arthrobacter sp. CAU 1506]|uniref:NtaA/DmoA family FMN-dependent monooxygenase n=1 Tax=Arthrobacter sp. CAU 1506 TaxID=2560052 RepID=UPI001F0FC93F|nr:NtaA/DmoA family FMN-dependent monooxygenase [Arthrobacter sp. CAU 1506]